MSQGKFALQFFVVFFQLRVLALPVVRIPLQLNMLGLGQFDNVA